MSLDDRLDLKILAMKEDWNRRARENARWYINTLTKEQSDSEFFISGQREFEGTVMQDLAILTDRRDPKVLRVLEIGCGTGRMTRCFGELFGEVYATDVSGEMIRQAQAFLGENPNIHFVETNGVDFSQFPDEFFDMIFSAYVYQHVPSVEIIKTNMKDAYRVLKPGGLFKFVTNGIENRELANTSIDTWSGATFCEEDIRSLAYALDAQLLGVCGGGTQYCWSMIRKQPLKQPVTSGSLHIISIGRADDLASRDLSPRDADLFLGIIVAGADYANVDINRVTVEIGGRNHRPIYTGPTAVSAEAVIRQTNHMFDRNRFQVNVRVGEDVPGGLAQVRVLLSDEAKSQFVPIVLPPPPKITPVIQLVINTVDKGVDLYSHGPKSRLAILFKYPDLNSAAEGARVLINEEFWVNCDSSHFEAPIGLWETRIQLPEHIRSGSGTMRVQIGELVSAPFRIDLRD